MKLLNPALYFIISKTGDFQKIPQPSYHPCFYGFGRKFLAKGIQSRSVMGIILALIILCAGTYFLYLLAKAEEKIMTTPGKMIKLLDKKVCPN